MYVDDFSMNFTAEENTVIDSHSNVFRDYADAGGSIISHTGAYGACCAESRLEFKYIDELQVRGRRHPKEALCKMTLFFVEAQDLTP